METLDPRAGFLTNYEVLQLLQAGQDERSAAVRTIRNQANKSKNKGADMGKIWADEAERINPGDLSTVTFEALKYLKHSHLRLDRLASPESVTALNAELSTAPWDGLSKAERLQLINSCPETMVELHVCVEEVEERYDPEQLEGLLTTIKNHLVAPPTTNGHAPSAPSTSAKAKAEEEEEPLAPEVEEDEAGDEQQEEEEDEELVQDGFYGGGEGNEKEIDEVDA